jgi:hypothetical protein
MPKRTPPNNDSYVYVLFRADGRPFYIGKGRGNRWLNHEQQAKRGVRSHKASIINKMVAAGFTEVPKVKIAEGLSEAQATEYEVTLIAAIGREPVGPLINQTAGGDGHPDPSPETRARWSEIRRGKTLSETGRAKLSAFFRGRKLGPMSDERRAQLRLVNIGRTHSSETRAKIRAALLGKKRPPEFCAKMSEVQRGRVISPEHRAKLSAANRGKKNGPPSLETRAKISATKLAAAAK